MKTAAALRQLCPFSLCVTNRIYERAKTMSFKARLIEDFRLAVTCTHRKDFNAGVKAVLVDKGKVAAQWQHARVEDVAHD